MTAPTTERVRFLSRVTIASGPLYHRGEEADLPTRLVDELVEEGRAERVRGAEPVVTSYDAPPVNRQMHRKSHKGAPVAE